MEFLVVATFIIALSALALYLSLRQPTTKHNNPSLITGAVILYGLTITMALDAVLEITNIAPEICGEGFTAGNCFLGDGLGVLYYLLVGPICLLVAYGLLLTNYFLKRDSRTHKKSSSIVSGSSLFAKHSFTITLIGYAATAISTFYTIQLYISLFSGAFGFTRPEPMLMVYVALIGLLSGIVSTLYRHDKHRIISVFTAITCIIVVGSLLVVFGLWMQPSLPRPS